MDDFAVFILTHGRADKVRTVKALERGNYTGKYYIVIDSGDDQADKYYKKYGDKVLMFDKAKVKPFDLADNFNKLGVVVFARNVCFEFAQKLNIKYFLELDDDYIRFEYRTVKGGHYNTVRCLQLDRLFQAMINFLETSGALTVAFAQGGDVVGGVNNKRIYKRVLRKAMNTFFCTMDRPFQFVGRINEDVNSYTSFGKVGKLLFTVMDVDIVQVQSQKSKGGMTELYLDTGTYLKSFYPVMISPSCVKIKAMGETHMRLHHSINWDRCVQKILSERYKK